MTAPKFILHRRRPDGTDAPLPMVSMARAAMYVSMSLVDNRECGRADADRFAAKVRRAGLGAWVEHPSGRAYMIEQWDDS